jgi:hypothetical protein
VICGRSIHASESFSHVCEAVRIGLCTECYFNNPKNLEALVDSENRAIEDQIRAEEELEKVLRLKGDRKIMGLKRLISDLEKEMASTTYLVRRQAKTRLRGLEKGME